VPSDDGGRADVERRRQGVLGPGAPAPSEPHNRGPLAPRAHALARALPGRREPTPYAQPPSAWRIADVEDD